MAVTKSVQFLPEIFRTETNKKFLNATVDQLINEPQLKKINGYIGRKLAPSFKNTDSYIREISADRQNYQLEPSVIIKNPITEAIEFVGSYSDLINQISYYGGITNKHDRLFKSEYYTYDPRIDFDKLINFSQYYWLENGPDAITISAAGVPLEYTFNVVYDSVTKTYSFTGQSGIPNPTVTLARGGTYDFVINDPDNPFFIQGKPGVSGADPLNLNVNTREVLGVTNNGEDFGVVRFVVPPEDAQLQWTGLALAGTADYATMLSYTDVQGATVDELLQLGGIDGPVTEVIGKYLIFLNSEKTDDEFWNDPKVVIADGVANFDTYDAGQYDPSDSSYENVIFVPAGQKNDIFVIQVYPDQSGVDRIILIPSISVSDNQKVRVRGGDVYAGSEFYSENGIFKPIPYISAPAGTLYYQNGAVNDAVGLINIVSPQNETIDPDADIVGQESYTSPLGVIFTNGLKVTFDSSATEAYQNKTFYVEGVGSSIRLINVANLTADELNDDLSTPDYITVNRGSIDLNPWSRTNRWFHADIIAKTSEYLNTIPIYNQDYRAKRPIIEFDADLQLYNFGTLAKAPVDILDTLITNAFTQVQGITCASSTSHTFTINSQTVTLTHGDRVVFANDSNNNVRNKIYNFSIVQESILPDPVVYKAYIEESDDTNVSTGHVLIVKKGSNGSKSWYFNGATWVSAQQKTKVNEPPLFDVIDTNGVSLSGTSTYPGSSFAGTKIFSYKEGTGENDPVLGFPLSYRNFIAQGDIEFVNNFDNDTFEYVTTGGTSGQIQTNSGLLQKNLDRSTSIRMNIWNIVDDFSKQFQMNEFIYDGSTNLFPINKLPDLSEDSPNIKVYVNNNFIKTENYAITKIVDQYAVLVNENILNINDAVFVLIYNSNEVLNDAFYEIPVNLDVNGENENHSTLTLGQLRNHLIVCSNKNLFVNGEVPGNNNLRDIVYKSKAGSVLQNSSPLLYSNLFLSHPTMNFVNSLKFVNNEYTKFRTKFLDLAETLDLNQKDIVGSVDIILQNINEIKNQNFAFYDSDMVPYSSMEFTELPTYTVFSSTVRTYEITNIFEDTKLQNKAVFVYLTRTENFVTTKTLLVKDRDFVFNQTRPAIDFKDDFVLLYGDLITIIEYSDTLGSYVPPTPTKLGLYPKYVPEIFEDDTYSTPTQIIQGHDGSITPCFGDFRDQLLLELEKRIYNNIKVSYNAFNFNIYDHIPGKFRNTNYSLAEYNQILSSMFLSWVGTYKVDFTSNNIFQASNPFTWNYKKFRDVINGEFLPGTWRSIYRYFYDTERPHTHPWEMLGFSEKPDYWNDRYGPAPYTNGNSLLWSDLSLGYIHSGSRAGFDIRYKRPNLQNYVPVDESGNLVAPNNILVIDFDSNKASGSYAVGDIGPAESAWRRSSEYPFAVSLALALMRPAMYFSLLSNLVNFNRDITTAQFLVPSTGQHITPRSIRINGYANETEIEYSTGYINWIVDYMKNLGIQDAATTIKTNLSRLTIQFTYKLGGYSDKKFVKLLAEQSSPTSINDSIIIPDENYRIELFKGAPLYKARYSAVIIEKSNAGYTVSGYDINNPYFFVIPVQPNNNSYIINQSGFRAVVYKDFKQQKLTVPYGFEFNSKQQVVDFLVGYQNYLISQGFIFEESDDSLNKKLDWILSATEFLHWCSQGWQPGSLIVVTPVNKTLKFYSPTAVVDEVKNTPYGSKIIDINSKIIHKNNFTISREDNLFSIQSLAEQSIGFVELNVVQNEHILILDNRTVFNDVIYAPSLGNRQYRLKLIGAVTDNWKGSLELPGFIYSSPTVEEWRAGRDYLKGTIVKHKDKLYTALTNIVADTEFQINSWQTITSAEFKTGVINNLATNAGLVTQLYDIDNQPFDENLQLFSNGIIGFRERKYFSDLGVDIPSQAKFYQGLIKQKGTTNALDALKGAIFNNINTNIQVYENWAVRLGEYGSIDDNQYIEIALDETEIISNPSAIQFVDNNNSAEPDITSYEFSDLYKISGDWNAAVFKVQNLSNSNIVEPLPTAGYVHLNDINATLFDLNNYKNLNDRLNEIGTGWKVWVAKDFNNDWNVYRAEIVRGILFALRWTVDDRVEFVHNAEHSLSANDIVVVTGFDTRFDGAYKVVSIVDSTRFVCSLYQNLDVLQNLQTTVGSGNLYKFTSMRVAYATDLLDITPRYGWRTGDRVWVDNLDYDANWGVYSKNDVWEYDSILSMNESQYQDGAHFGSALSLSASGLVLYSSAPDADRVSVFQKNTIDNVYSPVSTVYPSNTNVGFFGGSLADGDNFLAVGAHESYTNQGLVYVYKDQSLQQILVIETGSAQDKFGYSVAMSNDGKFLYIGAPGENKVYCFARNPLRTSSFLTYNGDGVTTRWTLPSVITNAIEVVVNNLLTSDELIPFKQYSIVQIQNGIDSYTFTGDPSSGLGNYYNVAASSASDVTVTLRFATDRVEYNSHGLSDGDTVFFTSITTTTGISVYTPYYVVGSSTNYFQISLTAGGGAIDLLTGDGTATAMFNRSAKFDVAVNLVGPGVGTPFVIGKIYKIATPGTTDFVAIGAADNNAGTVFTATGTGITVGVPLTSGTAYTNDLILTRAGSAYTVNDTLKVYGTSIGAQLVGTLTEATDLVTLNSHGLSNGDIVVFSSVTTTTGIELGQAYFVISATTNTFQISETSGGSVRTLGTGNGNGSFAIKRLNSYSLPRRITVTLREASNKAELNDHGLSNGDRIYFTSITTTTGISTLTTYYVVNKTLNDFQLATSVGGSAIDLLTGDGSGILILTSGDLTITVTNIDNKTDIIFNSAPALDNIIKASINNYFYSQIEVLPYGSEATGTSEFGHSLATNMDGSVVVVGAPSEDVNSSAEAGSLYVYHRTVTEFITDGVSSTYVAPNTFNIIRSVHLDDVELIENTDYYISGTSVQFPPFGFPTKSKRLTINTNQFVFDQKITNLIGNTFNFGSVIDLCSSGCNIVASTTNYSKFDYQFGAVSRFVNAGRVYGYIIGTIENPTVTPGHSIIINNFDVTFISNSLESVISVINDANIPGVTAENYNNKLKITSSVIISGQKLDIKLGTGTALNDLGIEIYQLTQHILHDNSVGERFGTSLALNEDSSVLAVGSDGADISLNTTFDNQLTTYDNQSTLIVDIIKDSGAVYLYDLIDNPFQSIDNPSLFVKSQKLVGPDLSTDTKFGKAIKVNANFIFVGVSNDQFAQYQEAGTIYLYGNNDAAPGWELTRYKKPRVDSEAVNSIFTYDSESSEILNFYDFVDPAKGKILGLVDQELDYKEDFDPASYNLTTNSSKISSSNFYWTNKNIGKLWWDLSQLRYIDYEQDDIVYRTKNWGALFPGSAIKIYEWVESDFLPSQYVSNGGNGIPKHADDSAYSFTSTVDPQTGIIKQKYYYWVGEKTTTDAVITNRSLSIKSLENYLIDPKSQGIPYAGLIAPNSIALFNSNSNLRSNKIILHLDLGKSRGQNLIHSEFELLQEGSASQVFPQKIIEKLRDSLAGFDFSGALVPDVTLNVQDRYGIGFKPRQSMFINRLNALRIFILTINSKVIKYPIFLLRTATSLFSGEPLPTSGYDAQVESFTELSYLDENILADGYKVLIPVDSENDGKWAIYIYNANTQTFVAFKVQSYKTDLFWSPIDWYSEDFIIGTKFDYIVQTYGNLQSINYQPNDFIKVLDNGNGQWLIYKVEDDYGLSLKGAQNATLVFNQLIYDPTLGSGFDSNLFGTLGFDNQIGNEIVSIFSSIYSEIFIKDLSLLFNELFFSMISYLLGEQKQPDWIFKTSFIDVFHNLRKLETIPNYVKDDQTFYENYINEVKPYRTKLREYLPIYDNLDTVRGDWIDFDLPSVYNSLTGTFSAPTDIATLSTVDPYKQWYDNYALKVTGFLLGNVGLNYAIAPNVEIIGGGGSGATAIATVNLSTQQLTNVIVTNPGSGYTSTPTVTINGVGTGAIVYPILNNEYYSSNISQSYNLIRNNKLTIKLDRVSYTSTVVPFVYSPTTANVQIPPTVITGNATYGNLQIVSGNLISYRNEIFVLHSQIGTALPFDYTKVTKIDSGNLLVNAIDRIQSFYDPTAGMTGKDSPELVSGIGYPGVIVKGPNFRANSFTLNSNIVSFNYSGLTINSGNVEILNFNKLGLELDETIRVEGNYNFDFKNNGYFKIISIGNDYMRLSGEVIETTYRVLLDNPVTAYKGNIITQANTIGNAYVLSDAINSRYIDIVHSVTGFQQTISVPPTSEIASVVSVGSPEYIYIDNVLTSANIQEFYLGGNSDVTISYLELETSVLDSNIYSTYNDTSLGIRADDIKIDGGAYYDTYSSHAPEELVPGRMFDSLELRVFTNNSANTATYGFRVFHPMNGLPEFRRISANNSTTLSADLGITDKIIFVNDSTNLPKPNPEAGIPGVVFINGEKIHYYKHYNTADLAASIPWTANTIFSTGTLVDVDTGRLYSNLESNVQGVFFDVRSYNTGYSVSLTSSSANIFVGNAFTVYGNLVGGTYGVNDVNVIVTTDTLNIFYTASGTPTAASSNTYLVIGNVYSNANSYINSANLEIVYPNTLTQIRRGVDGTGTAFYSANTKMVDSSIQQIVPDSGFLSTNVYSRGNLTVTSNVSYKLRLSSNVSVNSGDFITQFVGNTGNVRVLDTVTNSNVVAVDLVTGNLLLASNIGTRVNIANVNAFSTTTANITAIEVLGMVYANGNIATNIISGNLYTSNIWIPYGTGIGLESSTLAGAVFIREEPSYTP